MNLIHIVYFGSTELSAHVLEQLIKFGEDNTRFKIVTVVTQPDRPGGRKLNLESTPVSKIAEKYQINLLKPEKLNDEFIKSNLEFLETELYLVVAYGKIIPTAMLQIPKIAPLNIHQSLLPKFRGPSPIKSVILSGEMVTGVTLMLMDEQMDHGPTLAQLEVVISENDTDESLSQKLAEAGVKLLTENLPKFIAGELTAQPQNHAMATYTKIFKKEDGYFEIDNPPPSEQLDRMIRAFYPWPNVWTRWKGKIVKFYPEGRMQMEGKKIVSKEEFLRGYPDFPMQV